MSCPNKNLDEWKDLVEEVGEFEAYRDWIENNYEIRDPKLVEDKLNLLQSISQANQIEEDLNPPETDDFQDNYTEFESEKTSHKVHSLVDLATVKGLRKDNPILTIDPKEFPGIGVNQTDYNKATGKTKPNISLSYLTSDETFKETKKKQKDDVAVRKSIDDAFKKRDLIVVNGKAFVKSGKNPATRMYYPFLDYQNPIKFENNTYYFLTNKINYETYPEQEARIQRDVKIKEAASKGRFIIKPPKKMVLNQRLKKVTEDFLEHFKRVESKLGDVEEVFSKQIYAREKLIEQKTKEILGTKPEKVIREDIINSIADTLSNRFFNDTLSDKTSMKKMLNQLPTIVLANMIIEERQSFDEAKGEYQDITEFEVDDIYVPDGFENNFRSLIKPNTGQALAEMPDAHLYTKYINQVNEDILNDNFKKHFSKEELELIQKYINYPKVARYFGNLGGVKTKAAAIFLKIAQDKKRGKLNPAAFIHNYGAGHKTAVTKLSKKVTEKYPELKRVDEYNTVINRLKKLEAAHANFNIVSNKYKLILNTYFADVNTLFHETGHYVYNISKGLPETTAIKDLIDQTQKHNLEFREYIYKVNDIYNNNLKNKFDRDAEIFSHVYAAVLSQQGELYEILNNSNLQSDERNIVRKILDRIKALFERIWGDYDTFKAAIDKLHSEIETKFDANDKYIRINNELTSFKLYKEKYEPLQEELKALEASFIEQRVITRDPSGNIIYVGVPGQRNTPSPLYDYLTQSFPDEQALGIWLTTHTDNFKKFFAGADESVKNKYGEPDIFWHGTRLNYYSVDKTKAFSGEGAMVWGAGMYMTDEMHSGDAHSKVGDKRYKALYKIIFNPLYINKNRNPYLHELFINPSNPIDYDTPVRKQPFINKFAQKYHYAFNTNMTGWEFYQYLESHLQNGRQPYVVSDYLTHHGMEAGYRSARGGMQYKRGERHFIVYNPNVIKSINNIGAFSKDSGNKYFSLPLDNIPSGTPLARFKKAVGITRTQVAGENLRNIKFAVIKYNKLNGSDYDVKFHPVGQSNLFTFTITGGEAPPQQTDLFASNYRGEEVTPEGMDSTRANEIAWKVLTALTKNSNMQVKKVTAAEASKVTEGLKNPYKDESVFVYGDTIYVVTDNLNLNMAFHEFSHPILNAMWKNDSTRDTFRKMYDDIAKTAEGKNIISQVSAPPEAGGYSDYLEPDTDAFREEVLVRALATRAESLYTKTNLETGFVAAIKRILYHIKQFFRKLFKSPIRPENLDADTTLDQLAGMLVNDDFVIETKSVSKEDVVSFMRENNKMIDEIHGAGLLEKMRPLLEGLHKASMDEHVRALSNENLPEMFRLVQNQFGADQVKEMRKELNKFREQIASKVQDEIERNELLKDQAKAFIMSLYQLQEITERMRDEMNTIKGKPRTPEDVLRTQYINNFTKYFHNVLAGTGGAKDLLSNLPATSALYTLINQVVKNIDDTNKHADSIIKEGMSLLITDILKYQQAEVGKILDQIKKLEAAGVKKSVIKSYQDQYDKLRVTPETVQAMMSGMGDANLPNAIMEGWLYSTDPIVGAMGIFMKNTYNSINSTWLNNFTSFLRDINPLAKKAGINLNSTNVGAFTKKVTFTDYKAVWDEEKQEFIRTPVITFINPHREYKWKIKDINFRIDKAEAKYDLTNNDTDKDDLAKLKLEKEHIMSHMWREFTDEYYQKNEIFNTVMGQKAVIARDRAYKKRQGILNEITTESDYMNRAEEINQANKEIRELYSLYNPDGTPKDPASESYQIADILLNARLFNSFVYDNKPLPGEFQRKYSAYQQELFDSGMKPESEEFQAKMDKWVFENTVHALTKEFYDDKKSITGRIKNVYERINANLLAKATAGGWEQRALKISEEITDNYSKIWDTLTTYKDDDNQPAGTTMPESATKAIKDYEVNIQRLQKERDNLLTKEESDLLESLEQQNREDPGSFSDEDWRDLEELRFKGSGGISQGNKIELGKLYNELSRLQGKIPTAYYVDTVNEFLKKLNTEENKVLLERIGSVIAMREPKADDTEENKDLFERIKGITGLNALEINTGNVDDILNILRQAHLDSKDTSKGKVLTALLDAIPGFREWFEANHFLKRVWSKEQHKKINVLSRTSAWSIIEPHNVNYKEHSYIEDANGKTIPILGKPSFRFYDRRVKDVFRTGYNDVTKKVEPRLGIEQDVFGRWLPRSKSEGAPSDDFVNPEYEQIRSTDPDLFNLLTEINKRYLAMQTDADPYARLGYEFPRIRIQKGLLPNLETLQKGGPSSILTTYWNNLKAFFTRMKDDPDLGYNPDTEATAQEMQLNQDLTREGNRILVNGIYDIDADDVSLDFFHAIAQYSGGLERQKQLKKILPFFEATHSVLTDPINTIRDMKNVKRANWMSQYLNVSRTNNGTNVRAAAIKNKMDREFFGKTNAGIFSDSKGVQAIINAMFKGASFSYLAWQIPSAIANATVQITQNIIRAASGQQFTYGELAQGAIWASKASSAIASEIHRTGPNGLTVQLIHLFDSIPGATQSKLGTAPGRTYLRDLVSLSWLYSPRKFLENYATLQAFGAIMKHEKVVKTTNGISEEISYADAWELQDGNIRLKDGIDKIYSPGGSQFNRILNMIQHVQHDMNGAYDNFSQPEAYRYIIYRMFAFLRKYVTTMITNRFAPPRLSPGTQSYSTGFYTGTAMTLWKLIQDPKMFKNLSPEEIGNAKQFVMEMALVTLMYMMYGLFGWDPDDEDKYEKLRAKSGPLPLPFVEDTEYPFHADGWLSNHMLLQLLKLKSQTEMWIPWPGLGLKDYTSLASTAPVALGPTIDQYSKIMDNLVKLANGDTKAYYQRTIGPYEWQQQGDPKLYNYLMQIYGFRGPTPDPVLGIMKQEQSKVLQ